MKKWKKEELEHIRGMLEVRMKGHERRYTHSLGVSTTAKKLAKVYGVDPYLAAAAGLIHDWDKVLDEAELLARAAQYGVSVAGSPVSAVGLLHGPVAAYELPQVFPDLPPEVFQAVARHTTAAVDMSPLDMVVFVADGIEPNRRGAYAANQRALVGDVPLTELFFQSFSQGLVYVIQTGRYLYPASTEIYNAYAARRSR